MTVGGWRWWWLGNGGWRIWEEGETCRERREKRKMKKSSGNVKLLKCPCHISWYIDVMKKECQPNITLWLIFFCYNPKEKEKNGRKKITNYSPGKKVPVASIFREYKWPSVGEVWWTKSWSDEAPRLAKEFAHWFPSLRVWQTIILLCSIKSFMSWIKTA